MAAARDVVLREATDEYRRLLYVAMTRAAERLVVCGLKGNNKIPDGCWYQLVDNALADLTVRETADDRTGDGDGAVRRYRKADPHASQEAAQEDAAAADAATKPEPLVVPDWLTRDATREETARVITPSGFDEGARRPLPATGQNVAQKLAMLRGSLTHRLLQSLPGIPAQRRQQAAEDYLSRAGTERMELERGVLIDDVLRVLDDARFHDLFGPGSRAEVPIVGRIELDGETRRVNGQVDRLVVTPDWVLIADYKTNRPAPVSLAAAENAYPHYIRQLALYRAVLAKLYPRHGIRCALILTEVPDLMEISGEALTHALAGVTSAR